MLFKFSIKRSKNNSADYSICTYKLETFIWKSKHLPLFELIKEILILRRNKVYFLTTLFKTYSFDNNVNTYHIGTDKLQKKLQMFLNYTKLKPYTWAPTGRITDNIFFSIIKTMRAQVIRNKKGKNGKPRAHSELPREFSLDPSTITCGIFSV
ncbi:hypothetical protein PUN28_006164 [Cardiocondyla obscurior]|uniref:Uncharacterized protein n=1 Tax=Cardiocondyla obscurior TaxID=286306 RepID=A0AAW2G920_9HYME